MLQIERLNDNEEAMRVILDGYARTLWTAMPGIVNSYDPVKGTCVIQLAIQAQVSSSTGALSLVNIAPLPDVPVVYMGGGGFVATFPIQPGDEALVIFADRCIDGWWQNGGIQPQAEPRLHDLSDGFALIGPRSQANKIPNVSTTTAQFRSLDGSTYFEIAPSGAANIVAPNGLTITGNVTVDGTVTATGEGVFNEIPVSSHLHTGVTAGAANTGAPIA